MINVEELIKYFSAEDDLNEYEKKKLWWKTIKENNKNYEGLDEDRQWKLRQRRNDLAKKLLETRKEINDDADYVVNGRWSLGTMFPNSGYREYKLGKLMKKRNKSMIGAEKDAEKYRQELLKDQKNLEKFKTLGVKRDPRKY